MTSSDPHRQVVSALLEAAMAARGHTTGEAASFFHVTPRTVFRWLQRDKPSVPRGNRLQEYLRPLWPFIGVSDDRVADTPSSYSSVVTGDVTDEAHVPVRDLEDELSRLRSAYAERLNAEEHLLNSRLHQAQADVERLKVEVASAAERRSLSVPGVPPATHDR